MNALKPTKRKIILTIALFAIIVGPILINDDWYFDYPLVWNILVPTLLIEEIGPDLWWLTLPLTIIWFYLISCLIAHLAKWK